MEKRWRRERECVVVAVFFRSTRRGHVAEPMAEEAMTSSTFRLTHPSIHTSILLHALAHSSSFSFSSTQTHTHRFMGNTPSTTGNGTDPDAAVEAVTFTNSPYQRQHSLQQHQPDRHGNGHQPSYMSHQRHSSSPQPFLGHSSPPQDSIHPSTIPIASMPVDAAPRRFPFVKDQYMNDSPAGSSPFDSESSFIGGAAPGDISYQRRQQPVAPRNVLPGGGPRRRSSSLVSGGQSYGQYTDTFNEQALLATAAHQDKMEHQRLQQLDGGRSSYRNSARVSRAFGDVDPLKSLSDTGEGKFYCHAGVGRRDRTCGPGIDINMTLFLLLRNH